MLIIHSIMFIYVLIVWASQFTSNKLSETWQITIQKVLLLALTLFVTACASTIQSASISEAYKNYELQQFERTLELIIRAENSRETSPEMKAELTYLKAQTHESLGQQKIANTLYEYLVEQHKDSQYGYLASNKLSTKL